MSVHEPAARGGRRSGRDERVPAGTAGVRAGAAGAPWRPLALAVGVIAAALGLVDTINVLTVLHDAASRGEALPAWEPAVWEFTSGLAELCACPIVYLALRRAPPGRAPWPLTIALHLGASLAFSAVHVGLMMLLRRAIYAGVGLHYGGGSGAALYEYRKDLLAYLVLAGIFHLFAGPRAAAPPAAAPSASAPGGMATPTFDIVDGARILRVPLDEIVAATSAGNYVEFRLRDGRRRLMRATLREVEDRLAPLGFERTHRSWLVNARCVEALQPAGSGDYAVMLAGGVKAPLGRRYPQALLRLRNGG